MTTVASDRHTRLIGWLKVVFPLTALALLSTLFLLSRTIDPETQIPFADKEIQERLRDQQVTGPFFSGTTADGDQISFSAKKLTTPNGNTGANKAEDVRADLALAGGTHITITADTTTFDIAADMVELAGSVNITTTTGFELTSELLTSDMSSLNVVSPGTVRGKAPVGDLTAGTMTLKKRPDGDDAQLVFTNGVKLIYSPKEPKE